MSTFSTLNNAYTGLTAARQGLAVTGQNVSNANTEGYTRQRLSTSSIGSPAQTGLFSGGVRPGQGVSVDGIARLDNAFLDARVRSTAASAAYSEVLADALSDIETILQEPGTMGLSSQLQKFWSAWQDLANQPGDSAPSSVLLREAEAVAGTLERGRNDLDARWSVSRREIDALATEVNDAAAQVADLNGRIRAALFAGGSVNELFDQRAQLLTSITSLAGGSIRELKDGTVEVLIGGNAIVSGDVSRTLQVVGTRRMDDTPADPVRIEWTHRPGTPVALDDGKLAGSLSVLGAANPMGTGGVIAEAAVSYNAFALHLASTVNQVHQAGASVDGTTGLDFFAFDPGLAPALGLTVVPTSPQEIATGKPGSGAYDGSVADAISQLSVGPNSPDDMWNAFVIEIGASTRTNLQVSMLTGSAAASAVEAQLAHSSVSLDEENINILAYQHAYQAAARVMTAVDEMLDVLINRTGLVGR